MKVGVFALQGDIREHLLALERCGVQAFPVKYPTQIAECEALVIPGGESTTIGKLIERFDLSEPLQKFAHAGKPLLGTCAGAILLSGKINGSEQFRLGLMDIVIDRNAYGRQTESFEADLDIPILGEDPFRGVFIRAPQINSVGLEVKVLAQYSGHAVLCRQQNLLACTFHPELTDDLRLHRYFLSI